MTITATIRIHEQPCETEDGPGHYEALSLTSGRALATVTGPGEIVQSFGVDMWRLSDGDYALRDILAFARRGERGLSVVA
jgi:hypothetical protein